MENINIGVALLAIREICRINAECINCPMCKFCYKNMKLDPVDWDSDSIPNLPVKIKY